jgi:methionine synthase II (cobalamin-independent)
MNKTPNHIDEADASVKELVNSLKPLIKSMQKHQKQYLKQLEPMVRDAIASKNQDVNYLCRFVDALSEMAMFSGVGDELYNEALDYLSTFNPEVAKWYREYDKEMSGTYDDLINVAIDMAKEYHHGQKDKAGVDYFDGHLSFVGNAGDDWKEKIVGYLHDVAEDTSHAVEEIIQILKEKSNGVLTNEDAQEIETALNLLNSKTASSREEYIERLKDSFLATKVKLNDLRHNMDVSRIPNPIEKDVNRIVRYEKEYQQILGYLGDLDMNEFRN